MHVEDRLTVIPIVVAATALPWLVVVWILHDTLRRDEVWSLKKLRDTWEVLSNCVMALAVFVVISLVPTGILRTAWFAMRPKPGEDSFPNEDVLLYGAFWTAALTAIALRTGPGGDSGGVAAVGRGSGAR
jgi:hypothetical protein